MVRENASNPDSSEPASLAEAPLPDTDWARAIAKTPERMDLWDEAEQRAADEQHPEDVEALYFHVLAQPLDRELGLELCERAAAFVAEWAEDGSSVVRVLVCALEIDPTAEWAFRKLTMQLTMERRWDELLVQYDRVLAATAEPSRRIELCTEAAQVSKDLAGRSDRAITYLEELHKLLPGDAQITASLERLLEKEGRYGELVSLWRSRVPDLPEAEARSLRVQIAACLLDRLEQPEVALDAATGLLSDPASAKAAIALFERAFASPYATLAVKSRALGELRSFYTAGGQVNEILRVLRLALEVSPDPSSLPEGTSAGELDRAVLHHELASLLVGEGRDAEALDHYAALVVLQPGSDEAVSFLQKLAERIGRLDRYTDALAAAADALGMDGAALPTRAVDLLFEAGTARADLLHDAAGAIALYGRIFRAGSAERPRMLAVCQRLDGLLMDSGERALRLDVLERRGALEPELKTRRDLFVEAAKLADALGDPDRALAAYGRVLEESASDREAHNGTIAILDREARWTELVAALHRAAEAPGTHGSLARSLRVRGANVLEQKFQDASAAVDAWIEIERLSGADEETIDATAALLTAAGRWNDLIGVLERGLEETLDPTRRVEFLQRLGDVYREHAPAPDRALACYGGVLAEMPDHAAARAGLTALLAVPACRATAVQLLLVAFEETSDWAGRLSLLGHRLEGASDDAERTAMLVEAADLHEERGEDAEAALAVLGRALPLSPDDVAIEERMVRLADETGDYATLSNALGEAVARCTPGPRAADLYDHRGALLERKLHDRPSALEAYLAAFALLPDRLETAASIVRASTVEGRWEVAARAIVASAHARNGCEPGLLSSFEDAARAGGAWDSAASALAQPVADDASLSPALAGAFERRIAVWHRDERSAPEAAEAALERALARAGDEVETLRLLAGVQRRAPGASRMHTLLRLVAAGDDVLGALREAATIALDVLHDDAQSWVILDRLSAEIAARLERGSREILSDLAELSLFSVTRQVGLAFSAGDPGLAVSILVEAARLPLGEAMALARLHEAATIAEERLGDAEQAITICRSILERAPRDAVATKHLGELFAREGRLADLLSLRRHELGLAGAVEDRVRLRLDIAELLGKLGDATGQLETLRANLADEPAHDQSLAELTRLLTAGGAFADLALVLEEQAEEVEARGDGARAGELFTRASEIAEERFQDTGRALAARKRAVAFAPTAETFDALARLSSARGDHAAAVDWLRRRVAALPSDAIDARIATIARLGSAHLSNGQRDAARAELERGLASHEDKADGAMLESLREPLRTLYRAQGAWEPLVNLLTQSGDTPKVDHYREAASICLKKLGSHERAIPILDKLTQLAPTDRPARMLLSDALRETGDLAGARALLGKLLEEYGRRKPPERAEVHCQLARIAMASGDTAEAQRQLETATAMNMEHPEALQMLGTMYRDAGDLARAERMFGALLLIALRKKDIPADEASERTPGLSRSESNILLYDVLGRLGQKARAEEMLASAFEAAKSSAYEARRLAQSLRDVGDPALLLKAIAYRLSQGSIDPAARVALLSEKAALLSGPLGQPDEALAALLDALSEDASSPGLLSRTIAVARAAGALDKVAETLEQIAERETEAGNGSSAAALWFSLGEICERDVRESARALTAYTRAEALGAETIPVWRAINRAAAAAGDSAAQIRVLRHLTLAGDESDPKGLAEDVYRLAELELASPADITAGLNTLEWAQSLEAAQHQGPRYDRAGAMLRRAAQAVPSDTAVLAAYERVARASGDRAMLLDALERVAKGPGATMEAVREAVDLASAAGDAGRVEALLGRAVELGETNTNGLAEAVWARKALADRAEQRGDFETAVRNLVRAAEGADRDEALQLAAHASALAQDRLHNPHVSIELYEWLLDRDRQDADVWMRLLDLHRKRGDTDALAQKLHEAIECTFDAVWRIQLRRERAALLLDTRWEDAAAELSEILAEDEEDTTAAQQLTQLYERHGRSDALAELLERQLSSARLRSDEAAVLALSLRLGALLAHAQPEQAIDVYRAALDLAPDSLPLLQRLLALYEAGDHAEDRAEILERLLALSTAEEAAERALALTSLRESLGDEDGMARALLQGHRACPGDLELGARLAAFYTSRERWSELAELRMQEGKAATGRSSVIPLREAATLYLDRLDQPELAAEALAIASERAPSDLGLLVDTAKSLARAGQPAEARNRIGRTLAQGGGTVADRVALLRLRAEISTEPGELAQASADLEAAYLLAPREVAEELVACLERRREMPDGSGDRKVFLQLFDLLLSMGRAEQARDLIGDWIAQQPGDVQALRSAAFLDGLAGRWEQAIELCDRVVALVQGKERAEAALTVAAACERAGYPAEARPVLESVLVEHAGDARVRDALQRIYESQGAQRELAGLALHEACHVIDPAERFAALRKAGRLFLEVVSDPGSAIPALEAAREIRPRDGELVLLLADAYIGAGRHEQAVAMLDTALQAQKGRRSREVSLMQQRMASIAAAFGDRTNAAGWLNAALDSDGQNAEAAAELADIATELGQLDIALKALKAITVMKAPKPMTRAQAFVRQAQIARHQGDMRKAVLLAKKAQAEDPNLHEAAALLAELKA